MSIIHSFYITETKINNVSMAAFVDLICQ